MSGCIYSGKAKQNLTSNNNSSFFFFFFCNVHFCIHNYVLLEQIYTYNTHQHCIYLCNTQCSVSFTRVKFPRRKSRLPGGAFAQPFFPSFPSAQYEQHRECPWLSAAHLTVQTLFTSLYSQLDAQCCQLQHHGIKQKLPSLSCGSGVPYTLLFLLSMQTAMCVCLMCYFVSVFEPATNS